MTADLIDGKATAAALRARIAAQVAAMKEAGAKRALMLPVSAPFHCALMQPAATVMADALAGVDIHEPAVPLIANVRAEPVTMPGAIRLSPSGTGRARRPAIGCSVSSSPI